MLGVQDNFDSDAPTARMQAGMSGIMSEEMRAMIAARTFTQLEIRARDGQNAGGISYGYRIAREFHPTRQDDRGRPLLISSRMEIDPERAAVVRRIFELYANDNLSPQAIAAVLNSEGIPTPGSTWERTVRRKSKWLASTISSDPKRLLGIINNPIYAGRYLWNRTHTVKHPVSGKVKYVPNAPELWIETFKPELQIVDPALWQRTRERQTQRARGRGAEISKAIAQKRIGGRDPRHWLGGVLFCGACQARFQADSRADYVCPSYSSAGCQNDLRVKRHEVHAAVLAALETHLLSPVVIAHGRAYVESVLLEREREEEAAASETTQTKEMRLLDEQAAALRAMNLPEAALSAALAALERERQEIASRATPSGTEKLQRVRQLYEAIPRIVGEYKNGIQAGVFPLAEPQVVAAAREAVRRLLVGGKIVLSPDPAHTALTGVVRFVDLGHHLLELAGMRRKIRDLVPKAAKGPTVHGIHGSGGAICQFPKAVIRHRVK